MRYVFLLTVLVLLMTATSVLAGDCAHCWHTSSTQHSAMYHSDEYCCLCGKNRCVSTISDMETIASQHGEFYQKS